MQFFTPSPSVAKTLVTIMALWNVVSAQSSTSSAAVPAFTVVLTCDELEKPVGHQYAAPLLDSQYHQQCNVDDNNTPLSCSLGSKVADSCCYEATQGVFLATQFWDFNPVTGPDNLFTTHGLWGDKCAGGYTQYCNPSWEITNATEALIETGSYRLLEEMNYRWKNNAGPDSELWLHEFNKHATCMATVNPACYPSTANKYQYVADFYNTVISLQKTLPTYDFLASAGISPSTTKQYTKTEILNAFSNSPFGYQPYIGCTDGGALQEVWYYFSLRGAVSDGLFVPMANPGKNTCPDNIWFYPKGYTTENQLTESETTGPINLKNGEDGCLLADGKWTTSTTSCANFTMTPATFGGIFLNSTDGNCTVSSGVFNCAEGNAPGQFTQDTSNYIQYDGSSTWSAASSPSGSNGVSISSGGSGTTFYLLQGKA